MKQKTIHSTLAMLTLLFLLMAALSGCGAQKQEAAKDESPAPVESTDSAEADSAEAEPADSADAEPTDSTDAEPADSAETEPADSTDAEPADSADAEPADSPEAEDEAGMEDGARYEGVIMLEGMEESVRYEHIRNDTIGVEMDYDYEHFERRSEAERECFVSVYDDPETPENYLEVSYSPEDAETVAASVGEMLSETYEITEETIELDRAGSCIQIGASAAKGGQVTTDVMQMVYIIPAADGCRIATAHYTFESADGFGARFRNMVHTLAVIDRSAD